jgi:hypothetical protein
LRIDSSFGSILQDAHASVERRARELERAPAIVENYVNATQQRDTPRAP